MNSTEKTAVKDEWNECTWAIQVNRTREREGAAKFNKNDKRLYELYILFRIKLLLSAESKLRERIDDEIEKKSNHEQLLNRRIFHFSPTRTHSVFYFWIKSMNWKHTFHSSSNSKANGANTQFIVNLNGFSFLFSTKIEEKSNSKKKKKKKSPRTFPKQQIFQQHILQWQLNMYTRIQYQQ